MMLTWLKRLRSWFGDQTYPSPFLDCVVIKKGETQFVCYQIVGVRGLCLVGESASGMRLVWESEAKDKKLFWKLWKSFHKEVVTWEEDGEPTGF